MNEIPDELPLKPCCGEVLANEVCDCDDVWIEVVRAMGDPIIWRAVP